MQLLSIMVFRAGSNIGHFGRLLIKFENSSHTNIMANIMITFLYLCGESYSSFSCSLFFCISPAHYSVLFSYYFADQNEVRSGIYLFIHKILTL